MTPDKLPTPGFPHRRAHDRFGPPWRRRPGRIFFRFLFSFGVLAVLSLVFFGIPVAFFVFGPPGPPHMHDVVRATTCISSLVFMFVLFAVGRRIFRNIAAPLGDVMEAADDVAEGDLSARVPENGGQPFRQLARSFNRMAEELEQADEKRRNLTADVAHELRNPLHVIQGNLEGILDGVYEPTPDHIRGMLDESRLLSRLVDDLQTLSLAEAGQLHLVLEPVRLAELLEDVRTSFSGQAEALGVALTVNVDAGAESAAPIGDYERLQQVLGNLVSNALRHTSPGGQISLKLAANDNGARLVVQDDGTGIPTEDLAHIFDRFWKGDKARTRRPGSGSGLGLAIARQLVRAHGGTILAESSPGKGAIFTIDLPAGSVAG